jgi:ElaB/YqjD/DUF883 family membrane-anchored ribosome-binding protein
MAKKTSQGSGDTGEARKPEQIEEEIEQTREELGDTVAAVTEKADVKKQAKAKVSDAKKRATAKKEAAKEKATATKERATAKAKEATPESAHAGMQRAQELARENPLPVIVGIAVVGGFVLGWAMGKR